MHICKCNSSETQMAPKRGIIHVLASVRACVCFTADVQTAAAEVHFSAPDSSVLNIICVTAMKDAPAPR